MNFRVISAVFAAMIISMSMVVAKEAYPKDTETIFTVIQALVRDPEYLALSDLQQYAILEIIYTKLLEIYPIIENEK